MTDFKLIHGIYENEINHALKERLSRLKENYAVAAWLDVNILRKQPKFPK